MSELTADEKKRLHKQLTHPIAFAVHQCQGLLSLLSIVSQLPTKRQPKSDTVPSWQWSQYNPDLKKYVAAGEEMGKAIIENCVREVREALDKAMPEVLREDWTVIANQPGSEPSPGWTLRTATTLGQLRGYVAPVFPKWPDFNTACTIARDRMNLDGFAALVRALSDLHAR